jgi:hypothetical protein
VKFRVRRPAQDRSAVATTDFSQPIRSASSCWLRPAALRKYARFIDKMSFTLTSRTGIASSGLVLAVFSSAGFIWRL